jgi:hypothetical protein
MFFQMASGPEKRKARRVEFSRGIDVQMVAIDGTWRRPCVMLDVAEAGAKLMLKQDSLQGLNSKEFFLVLSTTGAAFRRCEVAWINGTFLGIRFIRTKDKNVGSGRP